MVVLRAIGSFFKKIWDWIKQTAWIQPLLIVGVIFGVIFSIPSIVKAVKASKKEKSTYAAYYHGFKYSLEGGEDSKADKFTKDLYNVMYDQDGKPQGSDKTYLEIFQSNYSELGNKFFVAYVAKDCEKCEAAKEGFKKFQDDFNKYVDADEKNSFNLVTIFTDDETSETTEDKTAFVQYLEHQQDFFAEVGSRAWETDFYKNGNLSDNDITALETADPDDFLTPTILLVELGQTGQALEFGSGVTEVMFGVEGSDKFTKATTLSDCWRHAGEFSNSSEN